MKPKNFLESLNCAAEGVIYALKNELHLRVHFIVLVLLIIISLILNISLYDFCIIMILSALVIAAELFNTSIEYILNLFTRDFHITVKYIKDISAGAVLFVSLISLLLGIQIISKYIFYQPQNVSESSLFISSLSVFLSVIAVVFFKAFYNSGRPFRGGMPSGHAAVSYSIFVSVSMVTSNVFMIVVTFIAATLISFSRFFLGIHKRLEVLYGAILGSGITLLLFKLFHK